MTDNGWFKSWLASRNAKSARALIVELESMGWHRETARRAVHEFREGDYVDLATRWHGVGPDLAQLPSSLDVGDRYVNLLMFSRRPRAFLFSGFLTRSECRAMC